MDCNFSFNCLNKVRAALVFEICGFFSVKLSGHVVRIGEKRNIYIYIYCIYIYSVWVGKPEGKRQFKGPRRR